MAEDKLHEVALTLLPGIGPQLARLLVSYCGSAKAVFTAPPVRLLKVPGIGNTTVRTISENSRHALAKAGDVIKKAEELGVQLLFYTSSKFPNRLKQIPDSPILLYYRGNADLNQMRIISMVGTRNPTNYGQLMTERIIEDLKPYNVMVVSGLAYGIDVIAHRAAVQAGLPTIGVMATGPETIYPAVHRKMAEKMLEYGGLLTENTFYTKPDAHRFPARNRIIAGMSDCTIVVEAALKSGSLISADIAHGYDREVMAVPGNITSPVSEGTNHLIRAHKAVIYTSAQDLVELMNWDLQEEAQTKSRNRVFDASEFSEDELKVLQVLLQSKEEHMDDLSWKAQVSISALASVLLTLEFKGVVKALPGKRFVLIE